jgi:ADP-glucose pyrophosphorylase
MAEKKKMVAYTYHGYWKDVGTLLASIKPTWTLLLTGDTRQIYTLYKARTAFIPKIRIARRNTSARKPSFTDSSSTKAPSVLGAVDHCVVSGETLIEEGASCKNAVIMNGAIIKKARWSKIASSARYLDRCGEKVNPEHDGIALVVNGKAANNMKDVIALLDCHNSPELGELTSARPLASTSFLGRYAFADFALSNFCNSEISERRHLGQRPSALDSQAHGQHDVLGRQHQDRPRNDFLQRKRPAQSGLQLRYQQHQGKRLGPL